MQATQIRTAVDVDTRRNILQAARRRSRTDIAKKPHVDFVAEEVMKAYNLKLHQVRGTALGADIDRLGEMLRLEMLRASLHAAA